MQDAPHDKPSGDWWNSVLRRPAVRQTLAGAAAGLFVFFWLELARRSADLQSGGGLEGDYQTWRGNVFLVGAVFGGCLTGFLVLAEELATGSLQRLLRRGALA